MRKKSGFTIVVQTIALVPKLDKLVCKLEHQVTTKSIWVKSTIT